MSEEQGHHTVFVREVPAPPSSLGDRIAPAMLFVVCAPLFLAFALGGLGLAVMAGRFVYDSVVGYGRPYEQHRSDTCSVADLYEADPRIDQ